MDGELELAQRCQVEEHLDRCETCASSLRRLRRISEAMHTPQLRFEPSAGLQERVLHALRQEANARPMPTSKKLRIWVGLAACAILALGISWNLREGELGNRDMEAVAREVASSHVRSLMGNHLFDVPSMDQHTVKPWFNGKLDFSPNVKDLAGGGFRLVGGRLDYISARPVAALVFQHNQHTINLFTWPGNEGQHKPTSSKPLNGYNSVHWSNSGMSYWAVGDVPPATLLDFARLYLE
jgi:anti-sigma factor RsiW